MEPALVGEAKELVLEAQREYGNPARDQRVVVRWHGPGGRQSEVDAFWDGGRIWRARFAPGAEGEWHFESRCLGAADSGLGGRRGSVLCGPNVSDSPFLRHGPVGVAANGRHLAYGDGTPFLWLGDTAWNGVLKADEGDWERYLRRRREQGFSVVQFVLTHWRAFPEDSHGERAYSSAPGETRINPAFFRRLDAKVAAVNRAGLLAAPVLLWAIKASGEMNPGYSLTDEDAILVSRYLVARYGAYQVAWMLGGDGDYRGESAERWRRIGRAVFGERHDHLVTMHPQGLQWVGDEFRDELWFDFIGYQSGHGDSDEHLNWLTVGPPAQDWDARPVRPIINLEPNYEGHVSYHSRRRFADHEVRRALYWSLLVSPTAGATYGHHGIWPWMEAAGVPMDHPRSGEAPPWPIALESAGAESVTHLRRLLDGLPWWRLRPAQDRLAEQPGERRAEAFVAVAATPERDLVVAYLPLGGAVRLKADTETANLRARWFDPSTGTWGAASAPAAEGNVTAFSSNGEGDRLLVLA